MIKWSLSAIIAVGIIFSISHLWYSPDDISNMNWEQAIQPGQLSKAHAFLENDCLSCHTPVTGVERDKCVACHANDTHVVARQPTVFHADIQECSTCHVEHRGENATISTMNHVALVDIGFGMLPNTNVPFDEGASTLAFLENVLRSNQLPDPLFVHPEVEQKEALLNCSQCHSNDDRHVGLFGNDCVQCHSTQSWSLPAFIHPSSQSRDCNQCHEAPPSHYMQHFKMISATVAGEPKAPVEACYACHQSTSWNDIKRAGWYKHH
ncbi:multiheme c-type cytochrome [Alteromonas mediterranea]|uniref:multiheme c-type cytochrome n=1 Tax=Alteromonas mediterranea TaxID=314275 RepID=UPI002FE0BF70